MPHLKPENRTTTQRTVSLTFLYSLCRIAKPAGCTLYLPANFSVELLLATDMAMVRLSFRLYLFSSSLAGVSKNCIRNGVVKIDDILSGRGFLCACCVSSYFPSCRVSYRPRGPWLQGHQLKVLLVTETHC